MEQAAISGISRFDRIIENRKQVMLLPKRARLHRRNSLRLHFPGEARSLRSPFRAYVLETMYDVARKELGSSLKSVTVAKWSQPGEPDSDQLVLKVLCAADWDAINNVQKAILDEIANEAIEWSTDQKRDYSEKIAFELEQVD